MRAFVCDVPRPLQQALNLVLAFAVPLAECLQLLQRGGKVSPHARELVGFLTGLLEKAAQICDSCDAAMSTFGFRAMAFLVRDLGRVLKIRI
jgi:hypothetical protein